MKHMFKVYIYMSDECILFDDLAQRPVCHSRFTVRNMSSKIHK